MVDAINNNNGTNSQDYYESRQVEDRNEKTPDQDNVASQVYKQTLNQQVDYQNQILQVIATQQPVQQIQQTAQAQISKGYLDIRV